MKWRNHRAFTLIELLVVISIIILVAVFVSDASSNELEKAKMTALGSNGKQIRAACVPSPINTPTGPWPSCEEGSTSTEIFKRIVKTGRLKVDFSFFAAPGVPAYKGTNEMNFTGQNNAWNLVCGFTGDEPDDTPFLFTRNLDIASLAELMPGTNAATRISSGSPFGDHGVVVITKGGASKVYTELSELSKTFNRHGATNKVCRTGWPMPRPTATPVPPGQRGSDPKK